MIQTAIKKMIEGTDLSECEAREGMQEIMSGEATQAQIAGFITALRMKGETIDEITGCAKAMRDKAERIKLSKSYYIDTCGTGGDGRDTFNISTAAALVAAAAGVMVAKHGNRSVSSKSGSADVLEALGVRITLTPEQVGECIERTGIGFMFAPTFHQSMRNAAGPRKELGIRTVFNILGPLTNPADARGQLLGTFDGKMVGVIAEVLKKLGIERAMVIHGLDGLDEITITGETEVSELKDGVINSYRVHPQDFGLNTAEPETLVGGNAEENARIIRRILSGENGPQRDVVVFNAAAAIYVGKLANDLNEGVAIARQMLDSGKAQEKLMQLIACSNEME